MKIILSRKGMDSGCGPCPSPVFPDGTAVSLPIPSLYGPTRYDELRHQAEDLGAIAQTLSKGRFRPYDTCHLDPDLAAEAMHRPPDWRPAFGQVGAAQKHLEQQGVSVGDVFLFFGWFRDVIRNTDGRWEYKPKSQSVHRLFGWLQIASIHNVGGGTENTDFRNRHAEFARHPHLYSNPEFQEPDWHANNTMYVARDTFRRDRNATSATIPGAGVFTRNPPVLTLTEPGQDKRSIWRLPAFFHPEEGGAGLSYHKDPARWTRTGQWIRLRSVGRGQEFVFDAAGNTEATDWLVDILEQAR